ncbi:hypothetical protein ACTXT7_010617 [Hymenolepis weldensis]
MDTDYRIKYTDHANTLNSKPNISSACYRSIEYAASPIFAPLHSENAILLKDVSPGHHRTVLTSQNANGGEQYEYGFLPATLVLSEINDTYTTLSESTQQKQSTGNQQALEFNEI